MKKFFGGLIVLFVFLTMVYIVYVYTQHRVEEGVDNMRFSSPLPYMDGVFIYKDVEQEQEYIIVKDGNSVAITPRVMRR